MFWMCVTHMEGFVLPTNIMCDTRLNILMCDFKIQLLFFGYFILLVLFAVFHFLMIFCKFDVFLLQMNRICVRCAAGSFLALNIVYNEGLKVRIIV